MSASVSVFGLGLIGAIWARHYESSGVLAATWNRTPRPGAPRPAASVEEAARDGAVLHVVVADPPAVESVLDWMKPALRPGKLVIQSSTIDAASSRRFQLLVESSGALYLEAPFTGSRSGAEARTAIFYVGGAAAAKAVAEPALALLSEARLDLGTAAQACALKLAFNLNLALQMEGLAEALAFARRGGVADEAFFPALRRNAGWSGLAALKEPKLRAGDFTPQFSVKHLRKDVRLALGSGDPALLPAGARVEELLAAAERAGFGEEDYAALLKLLGPRG